ncbi:MAG: hypothetical protein VYB18_03710, partial [Thermodesulfobacteriota bacterium]|nr:hypothetical protein [Thermodesulfobacteriota bacterium]
VKIFHNDRKGAPIKMKPSLKDIDTKILNQGSWTSTKHDFTDFILMVCSLLNLSINILLERGEQVIETL